MALDPQRMLSQFSVKTAEIKKLYFYNESNYSSSNYSSHAVK